MVLVWFTPKPTVVIPFRALYVCVVLSVLGIGASIGQSATSDEKWNTARDEFLKAVAEKGGAVFFEEILSHTPGASARASALINLSGGWDAFVNRVKIDLLGIKP